MKFLARCLSRSTIAVPPPQIKPLTDALAPLLEDSVEGARNEAAVCLGTLMRMVGERPLNALMDSLADVRKAKVKEAYEKATVKSKAGAGGPPRSAAPAPAKEPPKKKASAPAKTSPPASSEVVSEDVLVSTENKPLKKPPARFLVCDLISKVCRLYVLTSIICRPRNPLPLRTMHPVRALHLPLHLHLP